MAENSSKNKVIAWIVLSVLIAFFGYLTYSFVPGWLWHVEHSKGKATIENVDKERKSFIYSYFNIYESDTIKNKREVSKVGDLEGITDGKAISVTYSKYQSSYVRFKDIDSEPMLIGTILVYAIAIIGILLYIGVLQDKISLETLAGVNRQEENEEE